MRYKKPLLTELFSELYLQPGSFDTERILNVANSLRSSGFPVVEFTTSQKVDINGMFIFPRIRCWTSDRKKLIQLSPDQMVVNCVGEYLGWNNFRQLFDESVSKFEQQAGPMKISSISLNALDKADSINRAGFKLGNYLNCNGQIVPQIYADTDAAADISLGYGLIGTDELNRVIKISVRPNPKHTVIEIHSVFHRVLKAGFSHVKLIEQLHDEANDCFEKMITDQMRNSVMEGAITE